AVIDVIYNPLRTRLLLDAKERGLCTANGLSMLIAQALAAHNLFFGIASTVDDDLAQIHKILPRAEMFFSNIVLVGMPGCGKTTAGRELARLYNRDFIDTDFLIEKRAGRKVPDIITDDGEPAFRILERDAIAEAAAQSNRVIATGGGSVLLKENRDALLQNGIVIFLDSPPELLATGGRPLSQDLPALYRQRLPLYESMCHHKIAVDPDTVVTVHRIQEALS
ncbi:MAG: hypothetical protein FWF29_08240, partial [Treponema sp.]|nr:hypothetical protein [Treponema sp.]